VSELAHFPVSAAYLVRRHDIGTTLLIFSTNPTNSGNSTYRWASPAGARQWDQVPSQVPR
jgi:hypothetical protein